MERPDGHRAGANTGNNGGVHRKIDGKAFGWNLKRTGRLIWEHKKNIIRPSWKDDV